MLLAGVNFPVCADALVPEGGAAPLGGGIESEEFQDRMA